MQVNDHVVALGRDADALAQAIGRQQACDALLLVRILELINHYKLSSKLQQHLVLSLTDFDQAFWEALGKAVKAIRSSKEIKNVKDEAVYRLKVCSALFGLIQDMSEGQSLKDVTEPQKDSRARYWD